MTGLFKRSLYFYSKPCENDYMQYFALLYFRFYAIIDGGSNMKRILICISILLLSITLCSCLSIFGGKNQREMGDTVSFLTDGNKEYLEYSIFLKAGYVEIGEDGFRLVNEDLEECLLNRVDNNTETVLSGKYLETFGENLECKEGYEYLSEQLFENIGECKNFEYVILKNGKELYGAVNCYKNPSGRSGNLLANEDLEKSYILVVENGKIVFQKELKKTAVLAVNQSHYIAYKDKKFYSVSKENNNTIEICNDLWWDKGPTFYSYVNVYFADDIFMICANKSTLNNDYLTLIVGDISGNYIETLINNEKSEY